MVYRKRKKYSFFFTNGFRGSHLKDKIFSEKKMIFHDKSRIHLSLEKCWANTCTHDDDRRNKVKLNYTS